MYHRVRFSHLARQAPNFGGGAWASRAQPFGWPFDPPTKGKIAVKVINHYGDEVLRVYDVGTKVKA